jgi:hypothetical protein
VKGLLTGLNDEEIKLKTWYAGDMVFRRLNVKEINISRTSRVIYRGPFGLDEWAMTGDEDSWEYNDNELISKKNGSVARDIDFTEEVKIGYDISWRGTLRSKVILFTSDITTSAPNSGYELTFQGSYIRVMRLSDNTPLANLSNPRRSQPNEKARIEIQVNRKTKKLLIFIDDQLHGSWQDDAMAKMDGKGLMFVSDSNNSIALSNILVTEWDGFIDASVTNEDEFNDQRFGNLQFQRGMRVSPPQPKELPEGRMMLANGDSIEGEVLGIEDEMIKIKTPFTEVVFPVHRINNIALKKADLESPKLYNGDVRAVLADGSKFVFRLDDVKDGKLIVFSQNFGRAEFAQSAFKQIEFNIYPKFK